MENKFIADGCQRFLRGKKAVTIESIEKKFTEKLSTANPDEKGQIREQMEEEYRRLSKNAGHKPSPGTLW
jgi:hypothetical protein